MSGAFAAGQFATAAGQLSAVDPSALQAAQNINQWANRYGYLGGPSPLEAGPALMRFVELGPDESPPDQDGASYTFQINPSKLNVTLAKVEQFPLTKAGYERQGWQNDLIKLSYSGVTGAFLPNAIQVAGPGAGREMSSSGSRPRFDVRQSRAWQSFMSFYWFWSSVGRNLVGLDFYLFPFRLVGSISSFKFDLDADSNANLIRYSFDFAGLPRRYPVASTEYRMEMGPDGGVSPEGGTW